MSGSDAIIRELQWNVSLIKAESKLQPKELLSQANSVMIKELQRNTASLSMELAALMEKVEQMETRVDELHYNHYESKQEVLLLNTTIETLCSELNVLKLEVSESKATKSLRLELDASNWEKVALKAKMGKQKQQFELDRDHDLRKAMTLFHTYR